MIITKAIYEMEKETQENYKAHSQYLKYVRLLDQYFEIKNDEEKLQSKFSEIITQHQKLVQSGIIPIWRKRRRCQKTNLKINQNSNYLEYYFPNKKATSTSNLQSQWYLEEPENMIPQNTSIITKEMIKQFGVEQVDIQKEFDRYNSWFYTIPFQLIGAVGKLKLIRKK